MKGVTEAGDLPEKEKVFLKKGWDGWRVVYPLKREDGSTDWFVVFTGGSWAIFIKTLLFVALLLLITWSYAHDTAQCRDLVENICDYSVNITTKCMNNNIPNPTLPYLDLPEGVKINGQDT